MVPPSFAGYGKLLLLVGVGFALVLSFAVPAHSQTQGIISGTVKDTTGGAIVGASVTVTDVGRGVARTLTTDNTGSYSAPNLIPGSYAVHVVWTGFKAFDQQDINLGVRGDVHVDVTLQPGEQSQTVTVTEEVPAIVTTNAELSATISAETLSDLPVAGHNYVQLLGMLPGYLVRQGSGTGSTQYSNGLRAEYNIYVLDGVPDQETYYNTVAINTGYSAGGPEQAVMLPTDSIQEFNVIDNSKAELGWRPGAQVNIAIKSGTNSIHGVAFASGRGTGLTNKNAFAPFTPPVSFEDFDATVGGAIKKDKLFYLIGYEGQRYDVGNPKTVNVPTLASLGGQPGSSVPDAIADLQSHGAVPNPVMVALSGCTLGPPVTCKPSGLFSNTQTGPTATTLPVDFNALGKSDNGVGRVDYHMNDHHNFAVEFFDGDGFAQAPLSATQFYWSTPFEVHTRVARGWWTWVPNSTWVNDLRFGWDNILISNTGSYDCPSQPPAVGGATDNQWVPGAGAPDYSSFGFVSGGQPACAFPTVTISGFSGNVLGGASGAFDTSGIERWLDSVSWTHGKHITKFGGDILILHGSPWLNVQNSKGTLNFNTNVAGLNAYAGNTSALDNFMAGIVTTANLQVGTIAREYTYHAFGSYIQDDWRVLPRITLNLGLRYEYTAPIHEANGLIGNFALGTPAGITQQGQGSGPLYKMEPWGFAPRFGLAWDVTGKGKTVVRSGFNIIYQNLSIRQFSSTSATLYTMPTAYTLSGNGVVVAPVGSIDLAQLNSIQPPNKAAATIVSGQPFFGNLGNFVNLVGSCTAAAPCAIGGVINRVQMPEVLNWNFGVQQAITNSLTIDANYVGTHGQHLLDFTDINQPLPGVSGANNENLRRSYQAQYPWFSQMRLMGNLAFSNYNALQLVVRQRLSHGLTLLGTYTYSHALDLESSDESQVAPQDGRNLAAEYGNASFDIRHRFAIGPSYSIPGRPGYWQMLQGWQVTSTAKVFSGSSINATDAADDISGTGEGQDRWTLAGNPGDFFFGTATSIPCYANPATASKTWKSACTAGLPQACIDAASGEPNSPVGTGIAPANGTGLAQLNSLGCYMMGNSVIVPPAPGTFGSMGRYALRYKGTWEWDASVVKSWKLKESVSTQFRADIYNVTNTTFFAAPSAVLSSPATFGASSSTPDSNSPFVGTGGPRKIQLGLKILF